MMLVGLKTQYPQLNYADYLGKRARALLPDVKTVCFDDLTQRFAGAHLSDSEFVIRSEAAKLRLRRWFAANEIGRAQASGPSFVAQGDADQVVPRQATDAMVASSRSHGSEVDYRVYPGAMHGTVMTAALADMFDWLKHHGS